MAVDIGSAVGYLDLDIAGFLDGLRTAQQESEKATKNMAQRIGSGLEGVGKSFTSAGSMLTKSVTTPILGIATAAVKTTADFESSMSKVKAISGAQGAEFDALSAKAREMGANTKFSATEASQAFQYMAMAGWEVDQMMGGISGVMNLAAASGEDLASVSDIVTDAMTAFGMSAADTSKVLKDGVEIEVDNTTRFVDALAAASNSSNTNVAMLGESFKYVAPVAGALGYSVEDTAVALGLMANQGIKASQAGTALRTMLTNMANPTKTMSIAMDTLGVSLTDENGKMLSLMEVMEDLRKGFGQGHGDIEAFNAGLQELDKEYAKGEIDADEYSEGLNNLLISMYGAEGAQKAMLASQLAGKEGMSGLLAIVNSSDEDFKKLTENIYNASGTAEDMAKIMQDNLVGQITILLSALQELAIQFGTILLPVIKDAVAWLQDLIARLQGLSDEQKQQIVRWGAIAAAVGPVLLVLGKVITVVGSIITALGSIGGAIAKVKSAFTLLGTALGSISAPVLAVVAVIGVLIAAFVKLWTSNEEFRNNIVAIWERIKSAFEDFVNGMKERLSALGIDFKEVTSTISAVWEGFCQILGPLFEAGLSLLGNILSTVLGVLTGIFDLFIGAFSHNWEQAWNGVEEIFGSVWNFIKQSLIDNMNTIKAIGDTVLSWFGATWESVWTGVSNFFTTIWNGIKSFFEGVVNGIKTTASTVWNAIKTTTMTVFNAIATFFKTVWDGIRTTISSAVESIRSTINTVWNAIRTIIETVMNAINTVITNVWNAIRTTISTIINSIKSTLETVWNAIKTVIANIVNAIKTTVSNTFESMKTSVVNTVNNLKSTATSTFESMKTSMINAGNNIKSSVSSAFESMKTSISNAVNTAKSNAINAMTEAKNGMVRVWDGITNTFADIGKNVIQGLINGIGSMVGKLYSSIKEALSGLVDRAKDALDINSPSGVMRDQIGKWLPPGIAVGFESAMGKATRDMQKSLDDGISSLKTEDINVGIQDDMINSASVVADYYGQIENRLAESVSNMRSNLEYLVAVGSAVSSGTSTGYIGYNGMSGSNGDSGKQNATGSTDVNRGGNVYNFYTTKSIDEIEAAKQMQRAERDIAEGFA